MKTCQTCYYCIDAMQIAGIWWCACTHQGRSVEASHDKKSNWGLSHLNLPCWRVVVASTTLQNNPDYSQLLTIRPKKKLSYFGRLIIPWSYVIRSKIANLFTRRPKQT